MAPPEHSFGRLERPLRPQGADEDQLRNPGFADVTDRRHPIVRPR